MTEQQQLPFRSPPDAANIADHFLKDCMRAFDGQGAEGIDLWRDGNKYLYVWMEAHVDHDMEQYFLLDVRTNDGENETRDYLYVGVGVGMRMEHEWHNHPVDFAAPTEEHLTRLRAGLTWFVDRVVGYTETLSEGDR